MFWLDCAPATNAQYLLSLVLPIKTQVKKLKNQHFRMPPFRRRRHGRLNYRRRRRRGTLKRRSTAVTYVNRKRRAAYRRRRAFRRKTKVPLYRYQPPSNELIPGLLYDLSYALMNASSPSQDTLNFSL